MRAAAFWTCSNKFWCARSKLIERDIQKAIYDYAKPTDGYNTYMEVGYKHFYPGTDAPESLKDSELDLAFRKRNKKNKKFRTRIACELKVLSSSTRRKRIEFDLRKLASIKHKWPHIAAFLVVFSVGSTRTVPGIEVEEEGQSAPIPDVPSQRYVLVEHFKIVSTSDKPLHQGEMYIFEVLNVAKCDHTSALLI